MKLTTIWTMPDMALRFRLHETREAFWRWLAHRLPRSLAFWSFVDTGVRHTRDDEVITQMPYEVLAGRAMTEWGR